MTGIVQSQDANVADPTQLKAVNSAVRGNDPGRLLGAPMYGAQKMQDQKADRSGMRENRDPLTLVLSNDLTEFCSAAAKQLTVTFALGYNVVDLAVD